MIFQRTIPTHSPVRHLMLHFSRNTLIIFLFISMSLFAGMLGYRLFEHMSWVDSFLNASMILSGMGPANNLVTTNGKLFAGGYALFSGLAFIATFVMLISPLIHHLFHAMHVDKSRERE